MNASLMMYNLPSMQGALARYWTLIRDHLRAAGFDAPDTLSDAPTSVAYWTAPDMVLSQTCGLPYRDMLHDKLQKVGTPDYGLPDCPPGYYRSHIIKRRSDPRETIAAFDGARAGINEYISQSGFAALGEVARANDIAFSDVTVTGGHGASIAALKAGQIDIAAIDALTWHLHCRDMNADRDLVTIGHSTPTPGLPYICSFATNKDAVNAAVTHAIASLESADRETLMVRGLVDIPVADYRAVQTPAPDTLIRRS